jgi:cysteine dioxygenase
MCEHARSFNESKDASVPVGFHYPVFSKLREVLATLQREIKPVGQHDRDHVAHISGLLEKENVQKEEWSQFAHFLENRYTRHLVAHDENFTVLLLCWNKKQRSPIHDHSGSSCWVKVLEGAITERRFIQPTPDSALEEIGCATVPTGGVCYINDSQGLHEMANESDQDLVVTLHVYSPPYYYCNAYAMDGNKRHVSMLAAAAPPRDVVGLKNETNEEALRIASRASTPSSVSLVEFAELLDSDPDQEHILDAFDRVWLSPAEWKTYAHFSDFRFQRLLIHNTDKYSLLLLCWLPNQKTPPHTHHGSSSWVRVLTGALTFTENPDTDATRTLKLNRESETFAEDSTLPMHVMGNQGQEYAVSLHLYNPPYTELHYGSQAAHPCGVFPHCRATVHSHECLPVVQCQRLGKSRSSSMGSMNSTEPGTPEPDAKPKFCVLSNLADLIDRIEQVFLCTETCGNREHLSVSVMDILEGSTFQPTELERYWDNKSRNGGRIRLFETTTFNVTLNLWEPGHKSVAHDHDGSQCWVKVVEGSLVDISYENLPDGRTQVARNCTMATDDVVFYGPQSIHAMRNRSSVKRAATFHVYFTVCNSCRWYSMDERKPVKVSAQTAFSDEWFTLRNARSGRSTPDKLRPM